MHAWTALVALILGVGLSAATANAQTVQEVRVRWDAYVDTAPKIAPQGRAIAPPQPSESFTVLERRRIPGKIPRQRNPELSSDHLVVEAMNGLGETVDKQLIRDPRVLRAEVPGRTGELGGRALRRADPEFLLALPDDPAITEVRVYQPRWTGSAYSLDLLGTIPLR
jgi:hypothetical protein